jgi:hypothetical protein
MQAAANSAGGVAAGASPLPPDKNEYTISSNAHHYPNFHACLSSLPNPFPPQVRCSRPCRAWTASSATS